MPGEEEFKRGEGPQSAGIGGPLGGVGLGILINILFFTIVTGIAYITIMNRMALMQNPVTATLIFCLFSTTFLGFVAAVYKFPTGVMCFLVIELVGMFLCMDRLYILSYQLLSLFTINFYVGSGKHRSLPGSIPVIVLSTLAQGGLAFVLLELAGDLPFDSWQISLLPVVLLITLPERILAILSVYLFFRFAPRGLLRHFPPGPYHNEFRDKPNGMGFLERGPSVLGRRIGRYMILEAILVGFGLAVFIFALLPGLSPEPMQQLNFLIKVNLCVFVESVPIVVAVNFIMNNKVISPIRRMTRGMQEFARHGGDIRGEAQAYIEALEVKTGDELETLYHSMSDMIDEVNRYIERIEQEQQLEEDLRVAKAASDAKSNFLSHMSHEIRTPINAVIGMDEVIIRETKESNTLRYAKDIRNAGRSLLGIVNDILDFSRIESGRLEIIEEDYEPATVFNEAAGMIKPKADAKRLDFRVDVDPGIPRRLRGDDIRVRQCILNLLSNAVKYTQQGKVRLKIGGEIRGEDELILSVRVTDTGIGIKQEDLVRLTSPFERIEEERNRTIEGTGLGMSITSNLLNLMDSKLEVESEYGRGSSFFFALKQKIVDRTPIGDFAEYCREQRDREAKYRESFRAPDAHILVVDDTRTNLTVIRGLLRETGIQVDTAASGREMLDLVLKNYYDLIFLDQRMPVMDGIEALHLMEMMAERRNPDAPVVALTANAISGAREMFLSEGFRDYLTKPVDPQRLEEMLLKYLPAEKCFLPGTVEYEQSRRTEAKKENGEKETSEDPLLERIRHTEGIDYAAAISRCMKGEILIETLKDFRLAALTTPDEIERSMEKGDLHDVTIHAHSIKSSAAAVGATELSQMAAELEAAGDAGESDVVRGKLPRLLERFREYGQILSFLEQEETEEGKEEIAEDRLKEAYQALGDFLEAFDYDSAEDVLKMLSAFSIPQTEKTRYNKLKELTARLDRDGALALLRGGMNG
ncbi:MAG: response regulator [Lachnospiraceae bacterium]|nr:response regulator [Lachnospiraceae bacterium]